MKNNGLKNDSEIKVIQLNPKLRLFLLILCSWFFTTFLFWFVPCAVLIPYLVKNFYISIIIFTYFVFFILFYRYYLMHVGIKYVLKDLSGDYLKKNNNHLQKIKHLEISDVTQLFNVVPICRELDVKKQNFKTWKGEQFRELSWIEACTNRLVVNGKINSKDFSWGVVTKMKKNNLKIFLLAVLYFGPIFGIFWGLFPQKIVNEDFYQPKKISNYLDPLIFVSLFIDMISWGPPLTSDFNSLSPKLFRYKKMGVLDLFPSNVGKLNSENYLIFSAKLKNQNDVITLIPKSNNQFNNLDGRYEWPASLSETQKRKLKNLMKKMTFLPSIYLDQDQISIVMKKYYYNDKDNSELQTWELIKDQQIDSEIQFNYFQNAVKIYQIFSE